LTLAFVCPGQGSQSPGRQKDLAAACDVVQSAYAEASDIPGYDLWQRVQEGPVERLNETEITQPAMLAAGVAAGRAWKAADGEDLQRLAGHSLGALLVQFPQDASTRLSPFSWRWGYSSNKRGSVNEQ